ncbi:MAG: glycosyltransferase family 4 protein [Lachnospiraceae bacterium]
MKILILTNYANGLWLFRKELLLAFLEEGHTVYVSLPPDENVDKLRSLRCGGRAVRIIETPFERRGNNPARDLKLFLDYRRLLKQYQPGAVLTYTIKPNLYGGLACRLGHVPYLCNVTGLGTAIEDGGALSRILLRFYKISMKKAERVFFQNAKNREFMNRHGIAVHNSGLLPGSGVNLCEHTFSPYPPETEGIIFLAVIRIMRDKGIDEYLEAARVMVRRQAETGVQIRFWLAGEYEEESRAQYEPVIRELEDSGIIRYFGHIDNVGEVMAQSHVIVHPSYHEGLSNVLLEAAACGRPVLASRISGCVETFCEGESGFGFAIKSADALVQAMEKVLALSGEERERMGRAGRKWVEDHFDRNIVLQAYRDELAGL